MKIIPKLLLLFSIISFSVEEIKAQQLGAKDCFEAIQLSNDDTSSFINSAGEGIYPNEVDNDMSCLNSGERNSAWFRFNVATSGQFFFNIIPKCFDIDIDWAVYDITDGGCDIIALDPLAEVSCNFNGPTFSPNTGANGGDNPQDEYPFLYQLERL